MPLNGIVIDSVQDADQLVNHEFPLPLSRVWKYGDNYNGPYTNVYPNTSNSLHPVIDRPDSLYFVCQTTTTDSSFISNPALVLAKRFRKVPNSGLSIYQFPNVVNSGDFDGDGDFDIILCSSNIYFYMLKNDGSGKFSIHNQFTNTVVNSNLMFSDYNKDGKIDIIGSGSSGFRVFKQQGSGSYIEDNSTGLPTTGSIKDFDIIDIDMDGDEDLLALQNPAPDLYINTNGQFTAQPVSSLSGQKHIDFANLNGDIYPDVITGGYYLNDYNYYFNAYLNNGDNSFTMINTGITAYSTGEQKIVDVTNDGLDDVVIAGKINSLDYVVKIYKNNGNSTFSELSINPPVASPIRSIEVLDMENDGDVDLCLSMLPADSVIILENMDGLSFSVNKKMINAHPEFDYARCIAADFNNDNSLDHAVFGLSDAQSFITYPEIANSLPQPPSNVICFASNDTLTVTWEAGSDSETPVQGLTYAVKIGSLPDYSDILDPQISNAGKRITLNPGNAGSLLYKKIITTPGIYYCKVYTIDNSNNISSGSQEIAVNIEESVNSDFSGIVVSPNPCENQLAISKSDHSSFQFDDLRIQDASGQMLQTSVLLKSDESVIIDVSKLSPGLYFVVIRVEGKEYTRKFTKN
ncbi:hypothetical protein SDC9_74471 [bioreactor metagenome]|uniref:Secretion system C-terminal sorting domain-containing protein n=1 Tax=bioreactor metagenome TaxID=1076179 RepID=A0A644YPC6_9ZZZZ